MKVLARFKTSNVQHWEEGNSNITLNADASADNPWARYTPHGELKMSVIREVADLFEPGQKLLITIEKDDRE